MKQAKQLRKILLAGMVNQVARRLDDRELVALSIRKGKPVYRTPEMEDVVYLSTTSVLYKSAPDWIVYQEIFQTDKMYFRGVTAIEPEWLPAYAPILCNMSNPLSEPPPRYDPDVGAPFCHFSGTFGRSGWTLPVMELEFPQGLERYKWFAVFLLDGSVCPKLKKYIKVLLSTPQTMVKSWAALQPRTDVFLKTLVAKEVDSKASLTKQWEQDPKYLLDAYQRWLPTSAHNEVAVSWPPL
uniref:Uncharacterized protein n=1 Tax=Graphocephala atropunctata TaxID=36148 RepID=A0A1B6MBY0_9HEMI